MICCPWSYGREVVPSFWFSFNPLFCDVVIKAGYVCIFGLIVIQCIEPYVFNLARRNQRKC